jgi:hypothetical protein
LLEIADEERGGSTMSHTAMFAPAHENAADLSVASLNGRISADQFYEEEIDLFSKTGTGIAEGSSVASCDACLSDPTGDSE